MQVAEQPVTLTRYRLEDFMVPGVCSIPAGEMIKRAACYRSIWTGSSLPSDMEGASEAAVRLDAMQAKFTTFQLDIMGWRVMRRLVAKSQETA